MTHNRLSSENLHATTVALNGRAVVITGPSGSGKSDLALRLIDRGFQLVSDDRTLLSKENARLIATAPVTIAGKLEVRGIGIVDIDALHSAPACLVVELSPEVERLPDDHRQRQVMGLSIPLVTIDATTASAVSKVVIALEHLGLPA